MRPAVSPFRPAALLLGVAATIAAACTHGDSVTDPSAPMGLALRLSPGNDSIFVADTLTAADALQLVLTATASGHAVSTPKGVEWSTSDSSVVTLTGVGEDGSGAVRATGVGTAQVTARVNDERAKATIVVLRRATHVNVSPSAVSALAGDTVVVTARALDDAGRLVPGTAYGFGVSDPAVARIERTGNQTARVILLKAGSTQINVSAAGQVVTVVGTAQVRDFVGGTPGALPGPAGALTLAAGEDATCGLLPLNRGYCFGRGDLLGVAKDTSCFNDTPGSSPIPCTLVPLRIAGDLDLVSVSVGDSVACAAAADNKAYCWGTNKYGQLGNGTERTGTSLKPNLVIGAVSRSAFLLTRISAGGNHACALTPSGQAFCWGQDSVFQLGNGDTFPVNSTTPIPVAGGQIFTTISAGRTHTCAVQTDNAAFCWGDNAQGQLGAGSAVAVGGTSDRPVAVAGGISFTAISAGGFHSCGLTAAGIAYCWGSDSLGQLGRGGSGGVSAAPALVAGGLAFRSISAGRYSTCGITTGGAAYCWGLNDYGQLGNGTGRGGIANVPQAVAGGRSDFTAVTVGRRHACGVTPGGAYCWGSNVLGALGNELQALVQPAPEKTATPQ